MSLTLRIILILGSLISFIFCVKKIKEAKLKVENSITWMAGNFILVLMSIFDRVVAWVAQKIGFEATVNFVFFIMILFLLVQVFIDNLKIAELNEKVKNLNHYIALKENEEQSKIENTEEEKNKKKK